MTSGIFRHWCLCCSVLSRVPVGATSELSGLDPDTTWRYIDEIRSVMTHTADYDYKDWERQMGGPGLVMEIDEAFLAKPKYNVGRKLSKDDVIVFGMTEREGGPTRVADVQLLNYILEKERSWSDGETHPARAGP